MSLTGEMEVISDEAISAIVATVEPSSTVVGTSALAGGLSSWMTTIEIERPDAQRHTLPLRVEFELLGHLDTHAPSASLPALPLQLDRMQDWVITDLDRRPPDPSLSRSAPGRSQRAASHNE